MRVHESWECFWDQLERLKEIDRKEKINMEYWKAVALYYSKKETRYKSCHS